MTPRLSSVQQGKRVDVCKDDLCIIQFDGGSVPLELSPIYTGFRGASWSPDGSRIVFAACRLGDVNNQACVDLFVLDVASKKIARLIYKPTSQILQPAWSPDGKWIAFDENSMLSIIRPDGSGMKQVIPWIGTLGMSPALLLPLAWSPDSKQIAMAISVYHDNVADPPDRVWVINRDGSGGVRTILKTDTPIVRLAWSPDGKIAVALEDGKAYRIDPNCTVGKSGGCDESSRVAIASVPEYWMANFYPQWAGEVTAAAEPTPSPVTVLESTATANSPADGFARPILAAIANRKPDFQDDFSTGGKGWQLFDPPNVKIANGVLKFSIPAGVAYGSANSPYMSDPDFVFQIDTKADTLKLDSHIDIKFRFLMNQGDYDLSLYPDIASWGVLNHGGSGKFLCQGQSDAVALGTWMKIIIIARGDRFAIYLNDQPLCYFMADDKPKGSIALGVGLTTGSAEVQFDNLKYWNLAKIPGLP